VNDERREDIETLNGKICIFYKPNNKSWHFIFRYEDCEVYITDHDLELVIDAIQRIRQDSTQLYGDSRFYQLLDRMKLLHSSKNHDYAGQNDPLSNFRLAEQMGIPAWKGCLIRMSDKVSRLWSFAKKGELEIKDEPIEDTALDLAVYSLLMILLYQDSLKEDDKK